MQAREGRRERCSLYNYFIVQPSHPKEQASKTLNSKTSESEEAESGVKGKESDLRSHGVASHEWEWWSLASDDVRARWRWRWARAKAKVRWARRRRSIWLQLQRYKRYPMYLDFRSRSIWLFYNNVFWVLWKGGVAVCTKCCSVVWLEKYLVREVNPLDLRISRDWSLRLRTGILSFKKNITSIWSFHC